MTTNRARANDIAAQMTQQVFTDLPDGAPPVVVASNVIRALADAGLLMPDLPDDDDGPWRDGRSELGIDDEGFLILRIDPRPTHPGRARRIALKILAAADQAQEATS